MADIAVRSAANQLMVGFDGDCPAPIASECEPRPHGEKQSEDRHNHANQEQQGIGWEHRPRQPSACKVCSKNQQETQERGNNVFDALNNTLASFRRFAEKRHRQPPNSPNHPCLVGSMKGLLRAEIEFAGKRSKKRGSKQDRGFLLPNIKRCNHRFPRFRCGAFAALGGRALSFLRRAAIHLRSARTSLSKNPTTSLPHLELSVFFNPCWMKEK